MAPKMNTPAKPATTTPKESTPKTTFDIPILTPRQVEEITHGAVSYGKLKLDRMEAEANGTKPKIPFYRVSYRKVLYKASDVRAYVETLRVD